jgi:ribosome-binding factor A
MESVKQKQVGETVKRHFSMVLQQETPYIEVDNNTLITVTNVKMTPDLSIAKIYLSIYNTDNKQGVLLELQENHSRLKQALGSRLKSHMRRIPDFEMYIDDTLDEMYRLNELFDRLERENQMGHSEEE